MIRDAYTPDLFHTEPLLLVISGPSGVGKDAVLQGLKKRALDLYVVVTATDRPPRQNEVDGVDYFFVSTEQFKTMIEKDELIEHAWVYGEYKGIPKQQVIDAFASDKDVIMRLDVQGAATVRKLFPDAILVFLAPEDEEDLKNRIRSRRSQESPEKLRERLEKARTELTRLPEFDYLVANPHNRLDDAVDAIVAILRTEHRRVHPRKVSL